jgi:hypothetical protein
VAVALLLQDLINWMQENNIVQRILRTNLHQRQYVQEVQYGGKTACDLAATATCW